MKKTDSAIKTLIQTDWSENQQTLKDLAFLVAVFSMPDGEKLHPNEYKRLWRLKKKYLVNNIKKV